jgi:Ca-activated chloride channel homolog
MRTLRVNISISGAILAALLAPLAVEAQVAITPRPKAPQKKAESRPASPNLRVDTNLVLIPVSVSDPLNRPVTGLEMENFRLFEDKQERKITAFSMEDEPVAVGMVFDTSGSMGNKLRQSRMAAHTFMRTSNPEDEFFLVEFDNSPRLAVPLTSDTGTIENQLVFTKSNGSTALLDALMLALHEMRRSKKNKKALLVISDGGDNNSRYTENEIKRVMVESDCLVYAIGVYEPDMVGRTREEAEGAELLTKIAESTGGRQYPAAPAELPDIAQKIGVDLRNRYVLGFSAANQQRDGRYHRVQVVVVPPRGLPPLHAHWREGYYSPLE